VERIDALNITTIDKASRDKSKSDNKHKRQEVQVQAQQEAINECIAKKSKHKNQAQSGNKSQA
jgi:hypothetical protein